MRFLPGRPNPQGAAFQALKWREIDLLAYCSGNNLIILRSATDLLKTFYLPANGQAVSIDADSGSVAVACDNTVLVYRAIESYNQPLTYIESAALKCDTFVNSICWTTRGMLVCATAHDLVLWLVKDDTVIWKEPVPAPAVQCQVDPEAVTLATSTADSRLLKLQTRESLDLSQTPWDYEYLLHPSPVLWFRWQAGHDSGRESGRKVLQTFAQDSVLRFWAPGASGRYGLWASIACGEDGVPVVVSKIPEIELNDAELVLVFRKQQKTGVYVVSGLSDKTGRSFVSVEHMTNELEYEYAKGVPGLPGKIWNRASPVQVKVTQTIAGVELLCPVRLDPAICVLKTILTFPAQSSLVPQPLLLTPISVLTGHEKSIQHIVRSGRGDQILTQSRMSENVVWTVRRLGDESTLLYKSKLNIKQERAVAKADIVDGWVVTIDDESLVLWDTSTQTAQSVAEIPRPASEALCLFMLKDLQDRLLICCVLPDRVKSWQLDPDGTTLTQLGDSLERDEAQSFADALLIDPAGSSRQVEPQNRESLLLTYSRSGNVQSWSLGVDGKQLNWVESLLFNAAQVTDHDWTKYQMSSTGKLALAKHSRILILDTRHDIIEMDRDLGDSDQQVRDLDWATTSTGDALLGVGFSTHVTIYCQQRYDYSKRLESWTPIRTIDIGSYTSHLIGDSHWLKDGTFLIGAGNQLFIQDAQVNMSDESTRELLQPGNSVSALGTAETIFDISAILNGPLPVYHPQFLIQLVYCSRSEAAERIVLSLFRALRFATIREPQMIYEIRSDLGYTPEALLSNDVPDDASRMTSQAFDDKIADELQGQLARASLPYLTQHQQVTLLSVVQTMAKLTANGAAIDEHGFKYLLGYHLFRLHYDSQRAMNMRDFVWATLSETKMAILDIVVSTTSLSWSLFQTCGLPLWLELGPLRDYTERLAKQMFVDSRNPAEVTIYYLALKKKSVLESLWRVSSSHPEQQKTLKLLSRDFSDPRWKESALKNAYALLSKHRFAYAASFFLLGGSVKDACSVILRHLGDFALAVLVARLYDDDNPASLQALSFQTGFQDPEESEPFLKWKLAWIHLMTNDLRGAAEAAASTEHIKARSWIDDPVLMQLYRYIRPRYSLSIAEEMKFILRVSGTYSRMGCDVLTLGLLKEWEFKEPTHESQTQASTAETMDARADTKAHSFAASNGHIANGSTEPTLSPAPTQVQAQSSVPDPTKSLKPPPSDMMLEPDMSAFDFGF